MPGTGLWYSAGSVLTAGGVSLGGDVITGVLSGFTLPLTLVATGVTPGSYGSSTQVPVLQIDAKGRVTGITTAAIGGGTSVTGTGLWWSDSGTLDSAAVTLSGDVTLGARSGSNIPANLAASGVSAGTYGDATHVAQLQIDAKGRVTGASNVAISGGGGGGSVSFGAYASRPAAGNSGHLYVASDAPVGLWVDDGTVWHPMLKGQVPGVQPPAASTWTAVNAGSSTFADENGAIKFQGVNDGSSVVFRGAAQAWPSGTTTTNTVDGAIEHIGWSTTPTASTFACGYIGMRESSTSKMLLVGSAYVFGAVGGIGATIELTVDVYTNATNRSATTTYSFPIDNGPTFLRLQRASTSIAAQVSRDRQTWVTLASFTTTTVFTTAPDQYAFGSFGFNAIPLFSLLSLAAS